MKTYTLHVARDARRGDPEALEDAVLVRDGFSWGAFVFTFLWFFFHRLWLVGILVLLGLFGLAFLFDVLKVAPWAGVLAQGLLQILIGLEANSLRRWTLARRGKPVMDVVSGSDLEEAEAKAFARWLERSEPARPAAASPVPATPYRPEPVIGLFPDAERPR